MTASEKPSKAERIDAARKLYKETRDRALKLYAERGRSGAGESRQTPAASVVKSSAAANAETCSHEEWDFDGTCLSCRATVEHVVARLRSALATVTKERDERPLRLKAHNHHVHYYDLDHGCCRICGGLGDG